MARAKRHYIPGYIWHITHRCHKGEIIEDYPKDPRGHSCLLLGKGISERPVHVLCAAKDQYLVIIMAYLPDEEEWANNLRVRKK